MRFELANIKCNLVGMNFIDIIDTVCDSKFSHFRTIS
jgi:hypothetical protein